MIDMLSADRENDPELKKSRWIVMIVIFFELFNAWAFVAGITKALFFYDARLKLLCGLLICSVLNAFFILFRADYFKVKYDQ